MPRALLVLVGNSGMGDGHRSRELLLEPGCQACVLLNDLVDPAQERRMQRTIRFALRVTQLLALEAHACEQHPDEEIRICARQGEVEYGELGASGRVGACVVRERPHPYRL